MSLLDIKNLELNNTCPNVTPDIDTALSIMRALRRLGIDSFIAGGYARDMALGRAPKDIDIMVCSVDVATILTTLKGIDYKVYKQYYPNKDNCGDHFSGCIKLINCAIDLVLLTPGYDSPAKVVSAFDNFTCMFYMHGDTPVYLGEMVGKYPAFNPTARGNKQREIYTQNSDFFTL